MNPKMNLSALLILVLLCSLELVSSTPAAISTGNKCCTRIEKAKIPLAMVVSYYKTSSSCAKPAFVFVTKRGKRMCVNPADDWVRSHAAAVDSRSASTPVPVNSTGKPVKAQR